jgi:dienelactone hydrolase
MSSIIGAYGEWAARLAPDPPRLSFRRNSFKDVKSWQQLARRRFRELLLQPPTGGVPKAELQHQTEWDGVAIEHIRWQLPYGPPTEALVLKPAGARGRLPGVLAFHDHGGNKYFGFPKITRMGATLHPMMQKHQELYYGGVPWANELARRGYVVLVHDAFAFGSRRVRLGDLPPAVRSDYREPDPEKEEEIVAYNRFAANHEHILAKSLCCAGTTWPGVFTAEDQRALDHLCSRPDVDTTRIGCGGLSGGGLRTIFITALDARIRCSVAVGMMTTWRDCLLNKAYSHTWMVYVPGLANDLDYPEIFALNVPHPILVQNDRQDQLFTLPETQRADQILRAVYEKAGARDRYRCTFYDGPHKFDRAMQAEAFEWFDRWLK